MMLTTCEHQKPSKLRLDDMYRQKNLECAEIILADAMRYGGEESLMMRWARGLQNLVPIVTKPQNEAEAA